ncbi:TonB-dependent siderophore receptor [Halarcobacter mediterraneus]|uniref:TonB-dependent siderophore receptor n=1 Tax=Halarcobacter mediterraneus TaxID=2023153 RepID=UPI001E4A0AAD|nr:TonB-dependent receptor [Halarcobacter mediterraneus]
MKLRKILMASSLSIALCSSLLANEFTIENSSLEEAIKQISKKANMTYMVDGRLLEGKKAPALQNIDGLENVLKEVLKDTNLEGIIKDKTIIIREKKISTSSNNLGVVDVIDDSDKFKNSYTIKNSSGSTKMNLSLKETPQSISVITSKQIEDQNLQNVNDILLQTPGVVSTQYGQLGAGYTSYYARGFEITNVLRDGIPISETNFGRGGDFLGLEDSAVYEKVEIIKGSTGLTNGSGNPSASINYVRKKPTKEFQGNAKISYGSWDTYKGTIDISGGLNEDKSLRGRLVASYGEGDNQQDRYHQENSLIYGALDYDLSDNTLLTSGLTYQKTNIDNATAHGFPLITKDNPVQKQTTFGRYDNAAGDYTYSDTEKLNLFLGIEHHFNNDWKGIANYSYTKAKSDRVYGVAGSGNISYTTGKMSVTSGRYESTPDTHSIDLYTSGTFTTFEKEHTLSFGVNGYSIKSDDPSYGRVMDTVDINGWNGSVANRTAIVQNGRSEVDEKQIGAFAAINFQLIDPLNLIVGSRISNWERINNKGTASEQSQKYNGEFTPYIGLVYDINENFSTYTSYTSIFNPSTRKDENGTYLDPEEGNSLEFGLKSEFYDGLLNASIAYFITNQDNKAVADGSNLTPDGGQAYKSIDGAEVKGWDLIVSGQILPQWNISGGYTYTDAQDEEGEPLNTAHPKQTFKIFTSYNYNKLTLGGGINWQSEIYNSSSTGLAKSLNRQESYTLVNIMAKYKLNKDINVNLNINNLFDEEYVLNTSGSTWGAERSFTISLNYKF